MPVYVDDMEAPYRGMKMCHMMADTPEELRAMAKAIGVQLKWIQNKGGPREHFDIALAKKTLAVAHGAIPITLRQLGVWSAARSRAWPKRVTYEEAHAAASARATATAEGLRGKLGRPRTTSEDS